MLICVVLCGCGEQKNKGNIEMFIGTWEITEGTSVHPDIISTTWELHNNGSFKITNVYNNNLTNDTRRHTCAEP